MCHFFIFVLKNIFFLHFVTFFRHLFFFTFCYLFWEFISTLPSTSTQTINVIDLIFFLKAVLKKLSYEHAFQPYTYFLRSFSRGGGRGTPPPPSLSIDSDPQPL